MSRETHVLLLLLAALPVHLLSTAVEAATDAIFKAVRVRVGRRASAARALIVVPRRTAAHTGQAAIAARWAL